MLLNNLVRVSQLQAGRTDIEMQVNVSSYW